MHVGWFNKDGCENNLREEVDSVYLSAGYKGLIITLEPVENSPGEFVIEREIVRIGMDAEPQPGDERTEIARF
jgi:hypothetical protein